MGQAQPVWENIFTSALVRSTEGDTVVVSGNVGLVRAKLAESCLLVPKARDTVLLALLDDGQAWVLAVLRRNACAESAAELHLPEQTTLNGRLLTISAEDTRLQGKNITLEGETLGLRSRLLTLSGHILLQSFAVVRSIARSLGETVARRFGRYGALDESVEGLAKRTAGRAQTTVASSWRLRAENADMRAEKQVDIDASQIKVG